MAEAREQALASKLAAVLPHLDERQRRLLLGAEAQSLGHGGIAMVAAAAGVSRPTVSKGLAEVRAGAVGDGRVRAPGGGRKRLTETDPGLVAALEALVDPVTRTGLSVHAEADTNTYPRGIKISDGQMAAIKPQLIPDAFHGEWNYTLRPARTGETIKRTRPANPA